MSVGAELGIHLRVMMNRELRTNRFRTLDMNSTERHSFQLPLDTSNYYLLDNDIASLVQDAYLFVGGFVCWQLRVVR